MEKLPSNTMKAVIVTGPQGCGKTRSAQALLKRFGLFGPPGVLFFDKQGREQADACGGED